MLFRFSVFAILVSVAYADLIRKLQCTCQGGGYVHEIEYYLLEGPGQFLTIKDQCIAPLQKNCTIVRRYLVGKLDLDLG